MTYAPRGLLQNEVLWFAGSVVAVVVLTITLYTKVRGHRKDSSHSEIEEYRKEKTKQNNSSDTRPHTYTGTVGGPV